jgi:mevalonate kinase
MITHFAPGKILLSGEYAVLHGAPAIALPTKMGQHFTWIASQEKGLTWKSFDPNGLWFEARWNEEGKCLESSDKKVSNNLEILFRGAQKLNLNFNPFQGSVETKLEFPREFGLGSSSSLICLIGKWAEVSPMDLFLANWKGSGYDVAVAMEKHAIEYWYNEGKPCWNRVEVTPQASEDWFFIYSNSKQSTYQEIDRIKDKSLPSQSLNSLHEIHKTLISSKKSNLWIDALKKHEDIISAFIIKPKVQQVLFPNESSELFFAKSLGAWGGDFILVHEKNLSETLQNTNHNFTTVINWVDFVM